MLPEGKTLNIIYSSTVACGNKRLVTTRLQENITFHFLHIKEPDDVLHKLKYLRHVHMCTSYQHSHLQCIFNSKPITKLSQS